MTMVHKYGVCSKTFMLGTQPDLGFVEFYEDPLDDFFGILVYDRMLTVEQEKEHQLKYLGSWRDGK